MNITPIKPYTKLTRGELESITDTQARYGFGKFLPPWTSIPPQFRGKKGTNVYIDLVEKVYLTGTMIPGLQGKFHKEFDPTTPAHVIRLIHAHMNGPGEFSWKLAGTAYLVAQVFDIREKPLATDHVADMIEHMVNGGKGHPA